MGFTWNDRTYATQEGASRAWRNYNKLQRRELERQQKEAAAAVTAHRMALADKIVMAIVDQICTAIIRPGPKPEERECYVMAQELRDFSSELRNIVADVLKIEADETAKAKDDGND